MLAQKDSQCGIGTSNDEWRYAVSQMFNVTYWPYIQHNDTYMCTRRFFSDSYDILALSTSKYISLSTLFLFLVGYVAVL